MRDWISRASFLLLPAFAFGCATAPGSRTYYDDLEGGDAAGLPDATGGGDVSISTDSPASEETGLDATGGEDGEASLPGEAGPPDGEADGSEAGAGAEAGPDAGVEAGCGPTDTPANCGACGQACNTSQSTGAGCSGTACTYSGCQSGYEDCDKTSNPQDLNGCETRTNTTAACGGCSPCAAVSASVLNASCDGTTCSYTCNPGYADCNKLTPPNTDGCEASLTSTANCGGCGIVCSASPGCVSHDNGVGQHYSDCFALLSTSTPQATALELAMQACTAWTGSRSLCAGYTCRSSSNGPIVCGQVTVGQTEICWSYHGSNIGYVDVDPTGVGFCPSPTIDTTWN